MALTRFNIDPYYDEDGDYTNFNEDISANGTYCYYEEAEQKISVLEEMISNLRGANNLFNNKIMELDEANARLRTEISYLKATSGNSCMPVSPFTDKNRIY